MRTVLFAALLSSALLVGCGHKDELKYDFSENSCDTGEHKADSKDQYCTMLKDDGLNNGCAADLRAQEASSQSCG
jgi:hypothetical protein